MKFFISDSHFGHEKVIEYENRPFSSVEEMEDTMIAEWNSKVRVDDEVYHCGDFQLYGDTESLSRILLKLNGKKYLIKGNHDRMSRKKFIDAGFTEVYKKPIVVDEFVLSHAPMTEEEIDCYGMDLINIHGHTHTRNSEWRDNRHFNCSCEVLNYRPVAIHAIRLVVKMKKALMVPVEPIIIGNPNVGMITKTSPLIG